MQGPQSNLQSHASREHFGEIGTLPKTHHITVDENVKPVIHVARRIPFALKDRLKN